MFSYHQLMDIAKERVKDLALFFDVSDKFIVVKRWSNIVQHHYNNRANYNLGLVDGSDNFFEIFL